MATPPALLGYIVRDVRDIGGFDPTFDFRTDAGGGDPDAFSPMLKAYHKLLWSKPLPTGDPFDLDDTTLGAYLHHLSARGEFYLTSDTAMRSFVKYQRMAEIIPLISESDWEQSTPSPTRWGA